MGINTFPAAAGSTPALPGTTSVIFEGMITTAGVSTASKTVTIPAGDHIALSARTGSVSFSDGQSFALVANTPKVVSLPAACSSVTFTLGTGIGNYYTSAPTGRTALTLATNSWYAPTGNHSVAYTNGVFVQMGNSTTYYTSTDGITWTTRTSAFNGTYTIQGVNNLFFAFQASGAQPITTFYTSPDGVTWTSRTFPAAVSVGNIAYASTIGRYCVITANTSTNYSAGPTYYSTDGFTWTAGTILPAGQWPNLAASPTRFVASQGYQQAGPSVTQGAAYSTTGTSFTTSTRVNSTYNCWTVYSPDGYFYSQNSFTGGPERSTDGVTWANTSGGIINYMPSGSNYQHAFGLGTPLSGSISGTTYHFMTSTSASGSGFSTDNGANWSALPSGGLTNQISSAIISNRLVGFSTSTPSTRVSTGFTPASFGLYAGPTTTV